jgi:Fe-S oxidoreductase
VVDEPSIRWFLVCWHRHAGYTTVREFADQAESFSAYLAAERNSSDETRGADPKLEIVLIGAESLAALQEAYPHYFGKGSREQRVDSLLEKLSL